MKNQACSGFRVYPATCVKSWQTVKQGNPRAKLAFDMYLHRLQAGIGAMVAVLGGIDALVFTAGVGENSPEVRDATCSKLSFLGIELDTVANLHTAPDADIAKADSSVRVLLIRAQEEWAIARECWMIAREPLSEYPDIPRLQPTLSSRTR